MKTTFPGCIASLAGWAVAAGLFLPGNLPAAVEPVGIGLLLPLAGNPGDDAFSLQNAVLLAAGLVLDAGGPPLRIVQRDSGGAMPATLSQARRLVEIDGVSAIIGPLASDESIELASEVAVPLRIPLVSPGATSPDISELQDDGFFLRTVPSDALQGAALAAVARERGWRRIGVLYVNQLEERGLARSFRNAVEASGGEVVSFLPLLANQASYRTELDRAFETGADAFLVTAHPRDGNTILRQMGQDGRPFTLLLPGWLKPADAPPADAPPPRDGTWGTAFAPPDTRLALRFLELYRGRFGEPADFPRAAAAFDAAVIVALAAARALSRGGPADGPAIRDSLPVVANPPGEKVDFSSLGKALGLLAAGEDVDYEGVSGPVDIDARGDLLRGSYAIWTVEGGEVKTIRIQDFEPR
jgi:branched-chain amino acid transport system substrate-binding protein